jgi:hypothetical protein
MKEGGNSHADIKKKELNPPPVASTAINREQVREQKIQQAIEKLIRGDITVEEYDKISWETHLESLGSKETKKSKLRSLFRR